GHALTQLNEGNGLASNNVNCVASTASGAVMVVATTKGVSLYRDGGLVALDQLSGLDVRHVCEDSQGRLWFSTQNGIVVVDMKTGQKELFNTGTGLASDDVRWIAQAHDKMMIASRGGVQSYSPGGDNFTTVDAEPASTLLVDGDGFL